MDKLLLNLTTVITQIRNMKHGKQKHLSILKARRVLNF